MISRAVEGSQSQQLGFDLTTEIPDSSQVALAFLPFSAENQTTRDQCSCLNAARSRSLRPMSLIFFSWYNTCHGMLSEGFCTGSGLVRWSPCLFTSKAACNSEWSSCQSSFFQWRTLKYASTRTTNKSLWYWAAQEKTKTNCPDLCSALFSYDLSLIVWRRIMASDCSSPLGIPTKTINVVVLKHLHLGTVIQHKNWFEWVLLLGRFAHANLLSTRKH